MCPAIEASGLFGMRCLDFQTMASSACAIHLRALIGLNGLHKCSRHVTPNSSGTRFTQSTYHNTNNQYQTQESASTDKKPPLSPIHLLHSPPRLRICSSTVQFLMIPSIFHLITKTHSRLGKSANLPISSLPFLTARPLLLMPHSTTTTQQP